MPPKVLNTRETHSAHLSTPSSLHLYMIHSTRHQARRTSIHLKTLTRHPNGYHQIAVRHDTEQAQTALPSHSHAAQQATELASHSSLMSNRPAHSTLDSSWNSFFKRIRLSVRFCMLSRLACRAASAAAAAGAERDQIRLLRIQSEVGQSIHPAHKQLDACMQKHHTNKRKAQTPTSEHGHEFCIRACKHFQRHFQAQLLLQRIQEC